MPIQHPFMISYPHGGGPIMQEFINKVLQVLRERLQLGGIGQEPWWDNRLSAGYLWNTAIQQRLCGSACLVVIYTQAYSQREYCLREFKAMLDLENVRRMRANWPPEFGTIIPFALKPEEDAIGRPIYPAWFGPRIQALDARKFIERRRYLSLAEVQPQISAIADQIETVFNALVAVEQGGQDATGCPFPNGFPGPADVAPWLAPRPDPKFPSLGG
jgi:hypothetical protein